MTKTQTKPNESADTRSRPRTEAGRWTARRLLDARDRIVNEPPDRTDFLHTVMCQVGMPRRMTDASVFERHCGHVSILLEAGRLWNGKEWVQQPLALRHDAPAGHGAPEFRGDPHAEAAASRSATAPSNS